MKHVFTPRRLLLLVGAALLAGLIWWYLQPSIVGIWTGRTPPALCNGSMQALRLTWTKDWEVRSYDYGCMGAYRVQSGSPPIIVLNPGSRAEQTFFYTVTDDLLVLNNASGTYTLTQCPKSMFACAAGE